MAEDRNRKWWCLRCGYCNALLSVTDATDLEAPPVTPPTDHFVRHHGQPSDTVLVIVYAPSKDLIA